MKKALAILLALAMVACFVPMFAMTASAASAYREMKLDGDLSEWDGLHTVGMVGTDETSNKKVTFYAFRTDAGLWLAADATHTIFTTGQENWWLNTNFEFFISNDLAGGRTQYFVYAKDEAGTEANKSDNVDQAVMKTSKSGDLYHTIVECFVSNNNLPEVVRKNGVTLGTAWKTPGDQIKGGEANGGGLDEYWVVPKTTWPDQCKMSATSGGLYISSEVEVGAEKGINGGEWTIDGDTYTRTAAAPGYSFASVVLGNAKKASVTFTTKSGGEFGILLACGDINGDKNLTEQIDTYYLVDFMGDRRVAIERNAGQWSGWAAEGSVTYASEDGVDVTLTVEYDNGKITAKCGDTVLVEWTDPNPLKGTGFALASKADKTFTITNVTSTEIKAPALPDPTPSK